MMLVSPCGPGLSGWAAHGGYRQGEPGKFGEFLDDRETVCCTTLHYYSSPITSLVLTERSQLTAESFEKLPDQITYPYAEPDELQKMCLAAPETVPQESIDMNKVLEVAAADELTGNAYSLAITAPDRVHFVKGTCREECRWWADVLSVFPRSKLNCAVVPASVAQLANALVVLSSTAEDGEIEGRHKRNATFPGGQSSSILPQAPTIRATTTPSESRPRFNSCRTEPAPTQPWDRDVYPSRDLHTLAELPPTLPSDTRKVYRDQPASSASPPTRDKIQTEEKIRTRRVLNREKRGVKSARSYSEDFTGMLPTWRDGKVSQDTTDQHDAARRILFDDYENESKRDEKLKDIADSLTRPRYRRSPAPAYHPSGPERVKPTRDGDCSEEEQKKGFRSSGGPVIRAMDHTDSSGDKLVRGDPDGCGLDISSLRYSPNSELRVDLPSEDLLNIKKGWLMKQGLNKEWNKHWFVLRGTALMYYRDPTAEDKGIMDGVIDLSGVSGVTEVQVARNYGFQAVTWDERRYVLSAVTAGIRGNWVSSLRRAAGLQVAPAGEVPLSIGEKLERELEKSQLSVAVPTPTTPRSIFFSSDEEYRTASEGGRRENEDWGEALTPLPPSPPLNRTPISRVKEKARSRSTSRSRVYKRSRSSPPSSRRSTLDSVRTDDLLLACCGELPESDAEESIEMESVKSSLYDTLDSQGSEVDELKRQLGIALCEVGSAEKELLQLRQNSAEVATLEKQVKELLSTLERTEEQLKQKTKDANESEALRKRYSELRREHEDILSQWRKPAVEEDWRQLYQQLQDRYQTDVDTWKSRMSTAESSLEDKAEHCSLLTRDLSSSQDTIKHLRSEVITLSERLAQGIEENESLYRRLRELEGRGVGGNLSSSRERGRSVDSLSDLTNIDLDLDLGEMDKERIMEEYDDLRGRFEKAVQEIRAMKRELRESHALYDDLELTCITLRQDSKIREDDSSSQLSLLVSRVEDLTLKLSAAEKQKPAKHARSESPQRSKKENAGSECLKSSSSSRLRRKSLDSATSSEPMKVLIRVSSLESKVAKAAEKLSKRGNEAPLGLDCPSGSLTCNKELQRVEVNVENVPEPMEVDERHSETTLRLQNLEMSVSKSRDKVKDCLHLLSSLKTSSPGRSQSNFQSDTVSSLEKHLGEVRDILHQCNTQYSHTDMNTIVASTEAETIRNSVHGIVGRFEELLRDKLVELFKKRKALQEFGQFNDKARMHLLAEKLAYESVLIFRIAQAVACSAGATRDFKDCVMTSELVECKMLLDQQKECEMFVDKYRMEKLNHLAKILAVETLSYTSECDHSNEAQNVARKSNRANASQSPSSLLEDRRIRQAWAMAQEAVNRELIQAEISHVTMRCGQAYEADLASEQETRFAFLAAQRSMLEKWFDSVEEILRREMEAGIEELTAKYEEHLVTLKKENSAIPVSYREEEEMESRRLLLEFADVIALKALIDARVSVICKETQSYNLKPVNDKPKETSKSCARQIIETNMEISRFTDFEKNAANMASELEADFEYLFQQYSEKCRADISSRLGPGDSDTGREELAETIKGLDLVRDDLEALHDCVTSDRTPECCILCRDGGTGMKSRDQAGEGGQASWGDVCDKCVSIRQLVAALTNHVLQGRVCKRCQQLQETIRRLNADHEEELEMLRRSQDQEMSRLRGELETQRHSLVSQHQQEHCVQDQEMSRLRGELETQRHSLVSQHQQEQAQLKDRARRLERRLGTLDSEYSQQVENLRAAYQKTLSAGLERDVDGEENVCQRYQAEIEQLRTLCEKGLVAMESSHRRIIAELEEKHRQELEQLRIEKEQALTEETQATLAGTNSLWCFP
uniref:(California timema) hypothetical protein n=1 Tax=Timema californicum TaxID=61474 RepID=A0A7R9PBX5_TIMCA|nr:unnamed protein product [Timema californicum]